MQTPTPRRSYFALIASLAVLVIALLVVAARVHFGGVTQPTPQIPTPIAPAAPKARVPEPAPEPDAPAAPPVIEAPPLPPPPPEEAPGTPAAGDLPVIENPDAPAPESALPPARE